ncbi:MAG: YlxR family protein [Synechococcus sp. SB0668_bin_15]|nr:YlxR family protein [Synechococcus sp. SB0668_bin_15]MXZ83310.1 YlxR family protein [Synechococcus sp. SB0666_bin_14]MYA90292.1 YlxR family protein [Synechococcus sp. SB0663_bin_10]MYC48788.1 YlxR family protein [Synechococcus sp. SB0662_bin_14]MYG47465.1 YlxR family protein [Synechococcus sp. SB0675_bin_6]MYJ58923.1 YlxR family protein [Synechococcus sp. SB0672_bin_6]MYK91033.1 YlxR family protein [Synechococcus sp. SB0669_bin_8]
MSTTHRPVVRRCVSCAHLKDRTRMLRLVRLADGKIGLGQGFGRSAYVCRSQRCLEDARRRKRVQKSLRIPNHPTIDATLAAELDNPASDNGKPVQDSPVE